MVFTVSFLGVVPALSAQAPGTYFCTARDDSRQAGFVSRIFHVAPDQVDRRADCVARAPELSRHRLSGGARLRALLSGGLVCPREESMRYQFLLAAVLGCAVATPASGQAPHPKSPRRATLLSVAATALPIAAGAVVLATRPRPDDGSSANEAYDVIGGVLIGLGATVGPSVGHFYAHRLGLLLPRLAVAAAFGAWSLSSGELDVGTERAALGIAAFGTMAVLDIARAAGAARAYNEERIALIALPPTRDHGPGLGLAVEF